MIVACSCRSLFRASVHSNFDLARKFTKTYRPNLQRRCCLFHGLNYNWKNYGEKDMKSVMDGKKRKQVTTPVWRPVSTQSSSHEESLLKDVKVGNQHNLEVSGKTEGQSQVVEVHHVANTECSRNEAHMVNELDNFNYSSAEFQEIGVVKSLGGALPSTGKHTFEAEASASLIRFIKGKEGSTQKNIEEEMGVKLIFPSSKKEDYITIEGNTVESVARASEKVKIIINEAIKSPTLDYSHFISLPLAIHPQLVEKLINFQNTILGVDSPNQVEDLDNNTKEDTSDEEERDLLLDKAPDISVKLKAEEDSQHVKVDIGNIPLVSYPPKAYKLPTLGEETPALSVLGIDKSIFIKPNTFHLTVLMLKLYNKDRVDAAAKVLQSVSSKVMDALEGRQVSIRLKGLECMRGSNAKAGVLYVPVEEIGGEGRLLRACQTIIDAFVEAGLVLEKDAQQKLKLHATLMNARHRKRKKRTRKVDSFDARSIFKKFGSEEWGEYLIREAHLSRRFVFDESGYYHCCASIPFPENMQIE